MPHNKFRHGFARRVDSLFTPAERSKLPFQFLGGLDAVVARHAVCVHCIHVHIVLFVVNFHSSPRQSELRHVAHIVRA